MLIAKIENGQVVEVADYQSMFPQTSFPPSGPDNEWMVENGCMFVNVFLPYDSNTEKLVPATPYIDMINPTQWVYTVQVEPLTPEEIAQREEAARQANKAQAESLLQATDWTATVDINNPEYSNPYLGNQNEFLAYRSTVRKIAVNPPVVVDSWPVLPVETWVDVPAN
jgi:hypothetical protein